MNELIKIQNNEQQEPIVSGRELHEFLEVKTAYKDWFPRMIEYGFEEEKDFCSFLSESTGGRPATDHAIKLDMAKEISMLQRNEKGKLARQYFIAVEKEYNTPEKIMARALRIADEELKNLKLTNSKLATENMIMAPKADYFDEMVDRNLLTNFRDTAKMYEIKQKTFIDFLIAKKYIYRDSKGKLMPYADKNNGLFEVKESVNEKTKWAGSQTMITPKGRETFRLLIKGLN
jgi:anti-repressor protein